MSKVYKKPEPKERRCLVCSSKLSASNDTDVCRRHYLGDMSKLSTKDRTRVMRQRGMRTG